MPRKHRRPGFDRSSRPDSYWSPADPVAAVLANIKGERRRIAARAHLTGQLPPDWPPLPHELLADELDETALDRLQTLAPEWVADESLEPCGPGEVEIARVVVPAANVTVVSLRAVRAGDRIRYRMIDGHGCTWTLVTESTTGPLSFEHLVCLLDLARCEDHECRRLTDWARRLAAKALVPLRVSSVFYPQLESWFEPQDPAWADGHEAGVPRYSDGITEGSCVRVAALFGLLGWLAEVVERADSTADIARAVQQSGLPPEISWAEAAAVARHWDLSVWNQAAATPEALRRMTANPHLPPEWETVLVRTLVQRSAELEGSHAPGPLYAGLERLARRGVLSRYPRALGTLADRLRPRPWSAPQAMNAHPRKAFEVILACPELPTPFIAKLDRLIAKRAGADDPRRSELAKHPSALALSKEAP